jgi:hypothetical protein
VQTDITTKAVGLIKKQPGRPKLTPSPKFVSLIPYDRVVLYETTLSKPRAKSTTSAKTPAANESIFYISHFSTVFSFIYALANKSHFAAKS